MSDARLRATERRASLDPEAAAALERERDRLGGAWRYEGRDPFGWLWRQLERQRRGEPHRLDRVELRHEGRCGRCRRQLTVPESIDSGIGPDCAEILGLPWARGEAAAVWDARTYLLAGRAVVTARSLRTGEHRTIRATYDARRDLYWVRLLTSPDEWRPLGRLHRAVDLGPPPARDVPRVVAPAPAPPANPAAGWRHL